MGPNYINAGVLLLNMKKIKETKVFENARNILMKKWFKMPDQSAIRKYVKDILMVKTNQKLTIYNDEDFTRLQELSEKHFNKGIKWFPFFHIYNYKQWQIDDVHKKLKIFMFDDIYDQYKKLIEEFNFNINGLPKE